MRLLTSLTCRTGLGIALAALALLAAAASARASTSARASSCVRIDAARDTLSPEERRAALLLFEAALAAEGRSVGGGVGDGGCDEEWTLSHVRLGSSITVVVASPRGRRTEVVQRIEELGAQYRQTVRALVSGKDPHDELADVVDRTNVTSAQTEALRVPSENLFFVRVGYGYATGPGKGGGAVLGLGWRRELNRLALDVSFANLHVLSQGDGGPSEDPLSAGSFTPVALGVNYHFRPLASATPYAGLGLGFTVHDPGAGESKGLDVRFDLGYEMLRTSTLRLFVQADAILPTYEVTRTSWDSAGRLSVTDRSWPATFSVSLGIGLGGRRGSDERD